MNSAIFYLMPKGKSPTRTPRKTPRRPTQVAPSAAPERAPSSRRAELRSTGNVIVPIELSGSLGEIAYFWNYVVRNRQRYSPESHAALRSQSQKHLAEVGIRKDALQELGGRGFVEVRIPYDQENIGWDMRIIPWESLLSLATKEWRAHRHLTVVRHLDRKPPTPIPQAPGNILLFVASAPGNLKQTYSFDDEFRLIKAVAGDGDITVERQDDPTVEKLHEAVLHQRPRIIHFTGVDTHQGAALLDQPQEEIQDGILLASEKQSPAFVNAPAVGDVITAGSRHAPELVAFNCYFSGARIAPLAVAAGARRAIGFQDIIDDTVAEQFFAEFYRSWSEQDWADPLRAFVQARMQLSQGPDTQVGDVVFWTGESVLPEIGNDFYGWLEGTAVATTAPALTTPAAEAVPAASAPPPATPLEIFVTVKPLTRLNYSLLHNNASLFSAFKIQKSRMDVVPEVEIRVELYVGDSGCPFRAVCRLTGMVSDFGNLIKVPLLANILRGRRESVQTSLFIEVKHDGVAIHKSTERVTLLPADEWTDDPDEWRWLPSFILPRDVGIASILTHAERYLRAFADDSSTGFDGYQRLQGLSNPDVVDLQVRAIWSALVYETPLTYINPPPTYTLGSQRLRTPGMILEERRGTCIDLAVLFAACLEYIGLFPVIFLIKGHSFPGYWRSWEEQAKLGTFGNFKAAANATPTPQQTTGASVTEEIPWVLQGPLPFTEIVSAVNAGGLVPIETVQLTERGSFSGALELGVKNLATQWSFDAMIDIQSARDHGVTPLPLFDNRF